VLAARPGRPRNPKWWPTARRAAVLGSALVVSLAVAAVVTPRTATSRPGNAPATTATSLPATASAASAPGAPPRASVLPEPERRHGPMVVAPGQVADLDAMAPGWAITTAPGSAADDIWFSITDHALHGNRNADIAILPAGRIGTFDDCALEQNYGVDLAAPRIRPGQLVCDITSQQRVALLRIVDVQYTADRTPDQITFDVVVWVRLHKS